MFEPTCRPTIGGWTPCRRQIPEIGVFNTSFTRWWREYEELCNAVSGASVYSKQSLARSASSHFPCKIRMLIRTAGMIDQKRSLKGLNFIQRG
jgi:hypothetical protein